MSSFVACPKDISIFFSVQMSAFLISYMRSKDILANYPNVPKVTLAQDGPVLCQKLLGVKWRMIWNAEQL